MSCILLWRPVHTDGKYVGKSGLRDILERRYGYPAKLSNLDIEYLKGVKDCGYEEVQILIDAIYAENIIEIFLEC